MGHSILSCRVLIEQCHGTYCNINRSDINKALPTPFCLYFSSYFMKTEGVSGILKMSSKVLLFDSYAFLSFNRLQIRAQDINTCASQ